MKAPPWYLPNRYDACRAWKDWFWREQRREPNSEDAFIAGVHWQMACLATAESPSQDAA